MHNDFSQYGPHVAMLMAEDPTADAIQLEVVEDDNDDSNDVVEIPLHLNANPDWQRWQIKAPRSGVSPLSIMQDLHNYLPLAYAMFTEFVNRGGEVTLVTHMSAQEVDGHWMSNPYMDKLDGDDKRISMWLANKLKEVVRSEIGAKDWDRDCDLPLSYFKRGTTVAFVYAVYDLLKGRPERGKSLYYDAFKF